MNPMFVSDEKAAAALGMSVESLKIEVVQKGLLHEFRDRNNIVFRFHEVKDLLTSLPLEEAVFSKRLAELREREGPKPDQRGNLTRPEVERILNVTSRDIDELLRDRLLTSRELLGQKLFPADAVRSLIPRFNPKSGKELFKKFVESSASQSARLLTDLTPEDEGALDIFEPLLLDEESAGGIEDSKEDSGISIFESDDDISEQNFASAPPLDGDSSTSSEDAGISIFDLDTSDEDDGAPRSDTSRGDSSSAITRVGFPLLDESDPSLIDSELKQQGKGNEITEDDFAALLDDDECSSKSAAQGEYSSYSERSLLAEWKRIEDESSSDRSPLASLTQRLERSIDPEAATTRKKVLEEFASRYDRLVADCSKKYPAAFVSVWRHCSKNEQGRDTQSLWRSIRLKFASRGAEERAAKAEIENAVRHASSKSRNLVKGYFALRLYAAAYEK